MTQDESNRWRQAVREFSIHMEKNQDSRSWEFKYILPEILTKHDLSLEEKNECEHEYVSYTGVYCECRHCGAMVAKP